MTVDKILIYVILIIVIILLVRACRYHMKSAQKGRGAADGRVEEDGNGELHYFARGSADDSVPELLNRMEWAAYSERRIPFWPVALITTIIVVALISAFILEKIPTPETIIGLGFVVFVPIYANHQMNYVHGGVYNDYYLKNNVQLLREKLKIAEGYSHPTAPTTEPPHRTKVMDVPAK